MELNQLESSKRSSIGLVQQMYDIDDSAEEISVGRHLSIMLTGVDHGRGVQLQRTKEDRN